jgi:hypothetical protein
MDINADGVKAALVKVDRFGIDIMSEAAAE